MFVCPQGPSYPRLHLRRPYSCSCCCFWKTTHLVFGYEPSSDVGSTLVQYPQIPAQKAVFFSFSRPSVVSGVLLWAPATCISSWADLRLCAAPARTRQQRLALYEEEIESKSVSLFTWITLQNFGFKQISQFVLPFFAISDRRELIRSGVSKVCNFLVWKHERQLLTASDCDERTSLKYS